MFPKAAKWTISWAIRAAISTTSFPHMLCQCGVSSALLPLENKLTYEQHGGENVQAAISCSRQIREHSRSSFQLQALQRWEEEEVKIYQNILVLQPCRQLCAVVQHLEQRGSEGTVVVSPHSSHTVKLQGHLLITLQQHTGTQEASLAINVKHETIKKKPTTTVFNLK